MQEVYDSSTGSIHQRDWCKTGQKKKEKMMMMMLRMKEPKSQNICSKKTIGWERSQERLKSSLGPSVQMMSVRIDAQKKKKPQKKIWKKFFKKDRSWKPSRSPQTSGSWWRWRPSHSWCLPVCDKDDNVAAATWSLYVFALCVCSMSWPWEDKTDTNVSDCGSLKSHNQQSYRQHISG